MRLLPPMVGNRLRTRILRLYGSSVGHGSTFGGTVRVVGGPANNLTIGRDCWINSGCHFDVKGTVDIGDNVAIAQDVLIITSSHHIGDSRRRAGADKLAPVTVGSGVWLGARSVLLPGVTIGDAAIVGTGAVVTKDVPPNSVVGGIPARVIRDFDPDTVDVR